MHTRYMSRQDDGSIIEFEAIDYWDAIEQYKRNRCSGELFISISLERQPSTFRKIRNERKLIEYDGKQLWATKN